MPLPHYLFFLVFLIPLALIFYFDKKNIKSYVILGLLTLLMAFIFENFSVSLGFWSYFSEPRVGLVALYTWGGYFYYIIFCYFLGNLALRGKRK